MNSLKDFKDNLISPLLKVAVFTLSFLTFLLAPVHQVSDSKYSMLVTQSLIRHGSFKLNDYNIPRLEPNAAPGVTDKGYPYQLEVVNNSLLYCFPPGSSVLSVPFVGVMNLLGVSAAKPDGTYNLSGEVSIQRILAALLMAGLTLLFYVSARLLLSQRWSLIVSLGGAFGTQIMSTASRALWSDTWGIFLLGIIVYLLLRQESQRTPINPILLATLLSWTYFVKPTYVASIIPISLFIVIYHRPLLTKYALTGMAWLLGFVIYSWSYFGTLLPYYYSSSRLEFGSFWLALAGSLISPSRGFLVFCPFLLFLGYLLLRYGRYIRMSRLLGLGICICVLHLVITSGFPHWWGGHSYGPRLMTGILPWVILISVLALKGMTAFWDRSAREYRGQAFALPMGEKAGIVVGSVLLAASIFIHGNGALSGKTQLWNVVPDNVDSNPSRLWDWTYPQFLAASLSAPRHYRYPPYVAGKRLDFTTKEVVEYLSGGWSVDEPRWRWTEGKDAEISFSSTGISGGTLSMKFSPFVVPRKHEEQRVDILVNGKPLTRLVLRDPRAKGLCRDDSPGYPSG